MPRLYLQCSFMYTCHHHIQKFCNWFTELIGQTLLKNKITYFFSSLQLSLFKRNQQLFCQSTFLCNFFYFLSLHLPPWRLWWHKTALQKFLRTALTTTLSLPMYVATSLSRLWRTLRSMINTSWLESLTRMSLRSLIPLLHLLTCLMRCLLHSTVPTKSTFITWSIEWHHIARRTAASTSKTTPGQPQQMIRWTLFLRVALQLTS